MTRTKRYLRRESSFIEPSCSFPHLKTLQDDSPCHVCHETIAKGDKVIRHANKNYHPLHFRCEKCETCLKDSPFVIKFDMVFCTSCLHQDLPKCELCKLSIVGDVLQALDKTWHEEHFLCTHCHIPLNENFGIDDFFVQDNKPYCEKDFLQLFPESNITKQSPLTISSDSTPIHSSFSPIKSDLVSSTTSLDAINDVEQDIEDKPVPEELSEAEQLKIIEKKLAISNKLVSPKSPAINRVLQRTAAINQSKAKAKLKISTDFSFGFQPSTPVRTPAEFKHSFSNSSTTQEKRASYLLPKETRNEYVNIKRLPLTKKQSLSDVMQPAKTSDQDALESHEEQYHDDMTIAEPLHRSSGIPIVDKDALVKVLESSVSVSSIDEVLSLQDIVGKGGFAVVRKAIEVDTKTEVAVKIFNKWELKGETLIFIKREIETLSELAHPNIRQFRHVYEDKHYLYVVMEFIDGESLFEYVERVDKVEEVEARCLIRSLLTAIDYIHSRQFIHQDIKTENILLSNSETGLARFSNMKLIDFGFCRSVADGEQLREYCGSYYYLAPEMITRQPYYLPIDLWSVGVLLYIILTGLRPFFSQQEAASGKIQWFEEDWSCLSPSVKDLTIKLLTVDPAARVTAKQALEHEWFSCSL